MSALEGQMYLGRGFRPARAETPKEAAIRLAYRNARRYVSEAREWRQEEDGAPEMVRLCVEAVRFERRRVKVLRRGMDPAEVRARLIAGETLRSMLRRTGGAS